MTILTPTYVQMVSQQLNGSKPLHITAAHEPTREGEKPTQATPAHLGGDGPQPQRTNGTCSAAGGCESTGQGEGTGAAQPLKVALVGTAPSSRMLAPYADPSWRIWGCSPGNMNTLPRVDLWFELHSNLLWPEHESYGKPYLEWLKVQSFPLYMQDKSLVERATPYPMNDMVAEFGDDFFTSSFSWMMALAIKMGAVEIALYGIDMASRDEYIQQRPGFYFFRHEARKRGIKVSAPHESDIMQSPPLYAYVDSTPFGRKIAARKAEVTGRVNGMVQQRDQLNSSIPYLQGALEDLDYFNSIWAGVSNTMVGLQNENAALKAQLQQRAIPSSMTWNHAMGLAPVPMPSVAIIPPVAPKKKRKVAERRA